MNVVELENVWKRFTLETKKGNTLKENFIKILKGNNLKSRKVWALKGVNFNLKKGECLGIVGENASGKTTLLKIIAGILKPTKGKVNVKGKVASLITLGVGFEKELTAKENVYLYSSVMGLSKKDIDEKYKEIVNFSGLEDYMDVKLKNFSTGMKMRLAFATIAYVDADIFLIDEVFSVGDGAFQKKCLKRMKKFKNEGKNIILVSHSLSNIRYISDKALSLQKGEIKDFGDVKMVLRRYKNYLSLKRLKSQRTASITEDNLMRKISFLDKYGNVKQIFKSKEPFKAIVELNQKLKGAEFELNFLKDNKNELKLYSKNIEQNKVKFSVDSLPLSSGIYETKIQIDGKNIKHSSKLLEIGIKE